MKYVSKDLPKQYVEVAHVRFDDVRTGFLHDLKAVFPGILLTITGWLMVRPTAIQVLISFGIFVVSIYPYFALHEFVHGIVIKVMTRQQIEIGFTRSGAFCAMPELYMNRPLAIGCTAAPLVAFSALFGITALILITAGHWMFLLPGFLVTLHLLGCRSDVHLLKELGKFKNRSLWVKDTGKEQWLYLPMD